MKVIAIAGFPGSGKSTLVRKVLEDLDDKGYKFVLMKYGKLVPYLASEKGLCVLGTYSKGEQFPGTDRMAMNAQPEVQRFLLGYKNCPPDYDGQSESERVVLFEGDRLCNAKMFNWLLANHFDFKLCIMQTSQSQIIQRRDERSFQDPSWRKGRETKVERLAVNFPVTYYLKNSDLAEQAKSVQVLVDEIEGKAVSQPTKTIKDLWK